MKRKNKSAVRKNNKRSGLPNNGCDLNSKIFATMEKHKEVFFVIRLNPPSTALPDIQDPDPVIHCDLMDGRDTFLTMAREKHHEFSSLRRVKFSSMAMLYELHVQNSSLSYTCNSCRNQIETRWHCSKCEDFDLCVSCYPKVKHEHHMDKIDLGLDEDKPSADPREARRQSIQRFIQFLEHACQCRDANCRMPSCRKMKTTMQHKNACRRPNCQICNQVNNLLLVHARDCKETKCLVPFCQQIQQKLKQREQQQRVRNEKLMRRRMQHMHALNAVHTPLSNGGAGGGSSSRDSGGGGGGNGKGGEIGYLSPSPFSSNSKPQQQPVPSKALEAAQQAQLMAQMSSSAAGKFGATQRISVPSSLSIGGPRPGMMDMQHSPLHPQQPLASSPMGGGPRWQSPIGQQQQGPMSNHMADAQQHMAMRVGSPFGPQGGGAVGGAMGMQPQQQGSAMNNPEMQKVLQMMRTSGQDEVAQKLRENPELLATFIKMVRTYSILE
jgi:E1A/CREB-binding protein